MMRKGKTIGCVVLALAATVLLGAAPAAAAEEDDTAAFADDSYNGFREVTGEGDDASWTISIRAEGAYIATWERDKGIWDSPEQALKTINDAASCRGEVYESVFDTISSVDEFLALPTVETTKKEDGGNNMAFAAGSPDRKAIEACSKGGAWNWDRIEPVATDDPALHMTRIPLSVIGPGVHRLFVVPVQGTERREHEFADGSGLNYAGGYEATGEAQWVTVAIPQPRSAEFPHTIDVTAGSLVDPSGLATVPAPFAEGSDVIAAAAPAALGAAVFTGLVGIPMELRRRRTRRDAGERNE